MEKLFSQSQEQQSAAAEKSHGGMPCGGRHACGKCMVYAEEVLQASETEQKLLERASCAGNPACLLSGSSAGWENRCAAAGSRRE